MIDRRRPHQRQFALALLSVSLMICAPHAQFLFPGEQSRLVVANHKVETRVLAPQKIPLTGGLLHASGFYFNATVGGQRLTLQVDTSYSSLIVPRKGCVGCRVGDRRYDPSKSPTSRVVGCSDPRCEAPLNQCKSQGCYKCSPEGHCCVEGTSNCAFNMFYGDGSSGNGTLYTDKLAIGSLQANVLLGAMHAESHYFELPYADGVFGLAFQKGACHPACIPPVMDTIVDETGLANVFTMCVSRYGGTLVLGAADRSLAKHDFQYVEVEQSEDENRFIVPAQSEWKVGQRTISVPAITQAMWSAGTSDIGVSKATFLALLGHLMEHFCHIDGLCSMTSWFRPQRCAAIPDESVAQMPNITMGLTRGLSITLTPDDYLLKYRVIDGKQTRCVAFVATDSLSRKGIGLLLGTTVMRRYAVVYDRKAKRVGLAPANPDNCGPKTGSDQGLPGSTDGGDAPIITADSPQAPTDDGVGAGTQTGEQLLNAEKCRAEKTCSGCAALRNCSYGYKTGRCVPVGEAGKMPYPYCTGGFCACFATGQSGWYVGVMAGVFLGGLLGGVIFLFCRKRQRRNQYQMVEPYEEQDLETF